jgi:sialidase-1
MLPNLRNIPGIEKQIVVPATDANHRNGEATAIRLANGDILLLWTQFLDPRSLPEDERPPDSPMRSHDGRGDDGYARISGMRSHDGGSTWSAPWVVVDDHDALINCMSPALTRMADGRLLLAYSWRSGGNPSPGSGVVNGAAMRRVRISNDEGHTWSAPAQITPDDGGYHTGCHDRAWTLPSGRVLVQCHSRFAQPGPPESWRIMTNWIAYSDDNGQTWQASTRLAEMRSPRGFAEASLAQRGDGSLLMVMRTTLGNSFFTESFDEGASWSPAYASGIVTPAAPSLLARLPNSEELLLIWNPNYNPDQGGLVGQRCPLLCAVSKDGGQHWGLPKAIETDMDGWWEYPGILFDGDRALLHYRALPRDRSRSHLVLAHIPIDWFYA